eukprot:m.4826 g.4826  ORF g.4826 m.4826 type:complete len:434 (-) comp3111_c0_seq1:63-1364(-)
MLKINSSRCADCMKETVETKLGQCCAKCGLLENSTELVASMPRDAQNEVSGYRRTNYEKDEKLSRPKKRARQYTLAVAKSLGLPASAMQAVDRLYKALVMGKKEKVSPYGKEYYINGDYPVLGMCCILIISRRFKLGLTQEQITRPLKLPHPRIFRNMLKRTELAVANLGLTSPADNKFNTPTMFVEEIVSGLIGLGHDELKLKAVNYTRNLLGFAERCSIGCNPKPLAAAAVWLIIQGLNASSHASKYKCLQRMLSISQDKLADMIQCSNRTVKSKVHDLKVALLKLASGSALPAFKACDLPEHILFLVENWENLHDLVDEEDGVEPWLPRSHLENCQQRNTEILNRKRKLQELQDMDLEEWESDKMDGDVSHVIALLGVGFDIDMLLTITQSELEELVRVNFPPVVQQGQVLTEKDLSDAELTIHLKDTPT